MMLIILIVALVLIAGAVYAFFSTRTSAADSRRDTLVTQGFTPCPERHAEIERRYNDLSTTTGQGGYTVRDPFSGATGRAPGHRCDRRAAAPAGCPAGTAIR